MGSSNVEYKVDQWVPNQVSYGLSTQMNGVICDWITNVYTSAFDVIVDSDDLSLLEKLLTAAPLKFSLKDDTQLCRAQHNRIYGTSTIMDVTTSAVGREFLVCTVFSDSVEYGFTTATALLLRIQKSLHSHVLPYELLTLPGVSSLQLLNLCRIISSIFYAYSLKTGKLRRAFKEDIIANGYSTQKERDALLSLVSKIPAEITSALPRSRKTLIRLFIDKLLSHHHLCICKCHYQGCCTESIFSEFQQTAYEVVHPAHNFNATSEKAGLSNALPNSDDFLRQGMVANSSVKMVKEIDFRVLGDEGKRLMMGSLASLVIDLKYDLMRFIKLIILECRIVIVNNNYQGETLFETSKKHSPSFMTAGSPAKAASVNNNSPNPGQQLLKIGAEQQQFGLSDAQQKSRQSIVSNAKSLRDIDADGEFKSVFSSSNQTGTHSSSGATTSNNNNNNNNDEGNTENSSSPTTPAADTLNNTSPTNGQDANIPDQPFNKAPDTQPLPPHPPKPSTDVPEVPNSPEQGPQTLILSNPSSPCVDKQAGDTKKSTNSKDSTNIEQQLQQPPLTKLDILRSLLAKDVSVSPSTTSPPTPRTSAAGNIDNLPLSNKPKVLCSSTPLTPRVTATDWAMTIANLFPGGWRRALSASHPPPITAARRVMALIEDSGDKDELALQMKRMFRKGGKFDDDDVEAIDPLLEEVLRGSHTGGEKETEGNDDKATVESDTNLRSFYAPSSVFSEGHRSSVNRRTSEGNASVLSSSTLNNNNNNNKNTKTATNARKSVVRLAADTTQIDNENNIKDKDAVKGLHGYGSPPTSPPMMNQASPSNAPLESPSLTLPLLPDSSNGNYLTTSSNPRRSDSVLDQIAEEIDSDQGSPLFSSKKRQSQVTTKRVSNTSSDVPDADTIQKPKADDSAEKNANVNSTRQAAGVTLQADEKQPARASRPQLTCITSKQGSDLEHTDNCKTANNLRSRFSACSTAFSTIGDSDCCVCTMGVEHMKVFGGSAHLPYSKSGEQKDNVDGTSVAYNEDNDEDDEEDDSDDDENHKSLTNAEKEFNSVQEQLDAKHIKIFNEKNIFIPHVPSSLTTIPLQPPPLESCTPPALLPNAISPFFESLMKMGASLEGGFLASSDDCELARKIRFDPGVLAPFVHATLDISSSKLTILAQNNYTYSPNGTTPNMSGASASTTATTAHSSTNQKDNKSYPTNRQTSSVSKRDPTVQTTAGGISSLAKTHPETLAVSPLLSAINSIPPRRFYSKLLTSPCAEAKLCRMYLLNGHGGLNTNNGSVLEQVLRKRRAIITRKVSTSKGTDALAGRISRSPSRASLGEGLLQPTIDRESTSHGDKSKKTTFDSDVKQEGLQGSEEHEQEPSSTVVSRRAVNGTTSSPAGQENGTAEGGLRRSSEKERPSAMTTAGIPSSTTALYSMLPELFLVPLNERNRRKRKSFSTAAKTAAEQRRLKTENFAWAPPPSKKALPPPSSQPAQPSTDAASSDGGLNLNSNPYPPQFMTLAQSFVPPSLAATFASATNRTSPTEKPLSQRVDTAEAGNAGMHNSNVATKSLVSNAPNQRSASTDNSAPNIQLAGQLDDAQLRATRSMESIETFLNVKSIEDLHNNTSSAAAALHPPSHLHLLHDSTLSNSASSTTINNNSNLQVSTKRTASMSVLTPPPNSAPPVLCPTAGSASTFPNMTITPPEQEPHQSPMSAGLLIEGGGHGTDGRRKSAFGRWLDNRKEKKMIRNHQKAVLRGLNPDGSMRTASNLDDDRSFVSTEGSLIVGTGDFSGKVVSFNDGTLAGGRNSQASGSTTPAAAYTSLNAGFDVSARSTTAVAVDKATTSAVQNGNAKLLVKKGMERLFAGGSVVSRIARNLRKSRVLRTSTLSDDAPDTGVAPKKNRENRHSTLTVIQTTASDANGFTLDDDDGSDIEDDGGSDMTPEKRQSLLYDEWQKRESQLRVNEERFALARRHYLLNSYAPFGGQPPAQDAVSGSATSPPTVNAVNNNNNTTCASTYQPNHRWPVSCLETNGLWGEALKQTVDLTAADRSFINQLHEYCVTSLDDIENIIMGNTSTPSSDDVPRTFDSDEDLWKFVEEQVEEIEKYIQSRLRHYVASLYGCADPAIKELHLKNKSPTQIVQNLPLKEFGLGFVLAWFNTSSFTNYHTHLSSQRSTEGTTSRR